ncbi:3-keto-5-aminohexanoate cleavage protein [Hoeflea sp. G2-23]|uniref:3-keto-5-aminohexanoate cleavage protein n=1 Tax=Hoeflea algicola TaxID=2983763 RepID=A0ABT3Z7Q5_9HYPH|nr:3-keto-5-aminohexanoate cleavage protein [Hoeflea algicola]MCY0147808.1 3-keto-5-aminohexanoate cleavage protein [Hoeflea algicola]
MARIGLFLQVALNGDSAHPDTPRTPDQIAAEAVAAVAAGAESVHIHPFDEQGQETLNAIPCAAAIRSVRAACPGVPISLSTSDAIEADVDRRFELISNWIEMPDLVTANQGQEGIAELCNLLVNRGVGIEAGLLSVEDAKAFVTSGLSALCRRVMVEPLDAKPDDAIRHAEMIENIVTEAGITLEQVHHGYGIACWDVNRRAVARGHGIRTGLEDVTVMPDGHQATGNADLVVEAAAIIRQANQE